MVSDHYLKKYSHNPIQTCGVHLLGQCSEMIRFWAMLPEFGPQNDWKWWFPTFIWKSISTIHFKRGVCTYCVSVQNWFAFWPRWPNFGPLVTIKWLKVVVSDHYVKSIIMWNNDNDHNELLDLFQIWCAHWLARSSQMLPFFAAKA